MADRNLTLALKLTADAKAGVAGLQQMRSGIAALSADVNNKLTKIDAFGVATRQAHDLGKALDEAKRKVEFLRQSANGVSEAKALKELAKDTERAKREALAAEKAFNRQMAAVRGLEAGLSAAGVDTRNLAAEQARLTTQLNAAARAKDLQNKLAGQAAARKLSEEERRATAEAERYNAVKARAVALEQKLAALVATRQSRVAADAQADADTIAIVQRAARNNAFSQRLSSQFAQNDSAVTAAGKMRAGIDSISVSLRRAQNLFLAFQGAQAVAFSLEGLANRADEYQNLNARLALVTRGTAEFSAAQTDLARIAKAAQAPLSAVSTLYARMAPSLRDMGKSQRDTGKIVESVALSLKISGASTAESASAMLQLSQAFASGVLRGEEFNAMMENAPRLARVLADGLGVPVGQLRKMAEDGQLTSEALTQVFSSAEALQQLRTEVSQLPLTIDGASQQLSNAFTQYIGQTGEATGVTQQLAADIQLLAANFGLVADATVVGGLAAVSVGVIGLAAKLLQAAKAAGTARLALLALSANPLVLLATAAAAAGVALMVLRGREEDLRRSRRVSAAALGETLANTQAYANTAVLTGQALEKLATQEVQGYRERLRGAVAYYNALFEAEARRGAYGDSKSKAEAAAQRDVYVKALADLRPVLAARLKLEKDHSAALARTQAELRPKLKTALDAQAKLYEEAGKKVEDIQKRRAEAVKRQAAFEAELLAGPKKKPQDLSYGDFQDAQAAARQAAVSGDPEEALRQVEALRESLRAMKEAGTESNLMLSGMAKELDTIENTALDKAAAKAEGEQETAMNKLIELQGIAKTLEAIKIGIDQAAAEAALKDAQGKLQTFADANPIIQRVIVQAQDKMLLDAKNPYKDAPKKAAGGLITGPGSDTSDNLLAWLSPGEFVMRAAAVRRWGVERLAAMNRYADGGPVTRAVGGLPSFAAGGAVGAPAFPHLGRIDIGLGGASYPVYAEPDVAAALRSAALQTGARR